MTSPEMFGQSSKASPDAPNEEIAKNIPEFFNPLEMYRLPGDPPLTPKDIKRYRESNTKLVDDLPSIIRIMFTGSDPFIRREAIRLIPQMPEQERTRLVEQGMKDMNSFIRREAIGLISFLPKDEQDRLWKLVGIDLKAPASASETKLYKHHPQGERFFRSPFRKTGSATTLLDKLPGSEKTLRDQVILRHIDIVPYLAWKRAYEASDFWKKKGFNYVPIEPIVSVRHKKASWKVDVFTRVLRGPSVDTWRFQGGAYQKEIQTQIKILSQSMDELGIHHGHMHEGNFVVCFERSPIDEVILDRPPRVYIIDFDQAISQGN